MAEIKLTIDGREVTGEQGQTILTIARANGIDIPTLCHDDRVEIFGSCGLCVVETEGSPRLFRSCATAAAAGMIVRTNSERITKSRKAALELIFSDHIGDCRPPCTLACPAQTDCQGYVGLIANGEYDEAYKLIKDKIPLPASIGRVCPHPCEEACRRELVEEPISIMSLKQFAADEQHKKGSLYTLDVAADTGKSVAIIGGGPGGLSAAYFLRAKGHDVTVYDAMPYMGGMLRYGIPEYRLPKVVLQEEIDAIEKMGVKFRVNTRIGKDITMDELKKNNDAVIVAIGAWSSTGMNIPGEDLEGVHGGIEFLWNIAGNSPKLLRKKVAIVGGGNTAMDACRTAVRSGASVVYNVYRRTRNEMPAEASEIDEAEEEGVIFRNLTNPLEIIGENGKVKAVRLQIMELGEPDASGRRSPVPVPGEEDTLDVDIVIMAIGQKPDARGIDNLDMTRWGTIIADERTYRASADGVFAIGDATNKGADIAITAIGEAKGAAEMVDKYLRGEDLGFEEPFLVKSTKTSEDFAAYDKQPRAKMPHRSPAERKKDFLEINYGFSEDEAKREAFRCLECGCMDYFECKLLNYATEYKVNADKYPGITHHEVIEDNDPYIRRNPDKCVLCGLCVRVCEEVAGPTAIGFMKRGFDTVIKPAFDADLKDTGCISCGQCVQVCPTGALVERTMVPKQVPLEEKVTESVCSFCSNGCLTRLTTSGNLLLRSLPSSAPDSLLCTKGRFGLGDIVKQERITGPLARVGVGLESVSYEVAIEKANSALRGLQAKYGEDSVAVSISDRYTNEEALLIKEYANRALKTDMVFSFGRRASGLADVFGSDTSTACVDDLKTAELIALIAPSSDMFRSVIAMRARAAVRKGAKLLLLTSSWGSTEDLLDDCATLRVDMADDVESLAQLAKALLETGKGKDLPGAGALSASLSELKVSDEIKAAADMISGAGKVVFVFEKEILCVPAARLVADIAAISGNTGGPGSGVFQALHGGNAQGLTNLGIRSRDDFYALAAKGKIKGLFVFGEEAKKLDFSSIEFLAAQDTCMTDTARQADVLLPLSSCAEKSGGFISSDNKARTLRQAIASPVAWDNIRQIKALIENAGVASAYKTLDDLSLAAGAGAASAELDPGRIKLAVPR